MRDRVQVRRHDMVYVAPDAWQALLQDRPDLAGIAVLVDWARLGRPLVVRRPACADQDGLVPVGLPLSPSLGKLRIALGLPAAAILRTGPPPLLAEAAASAPLAWRASIARLLAVSPDLRVYGSLAWQHLTGLAYVTGHSDLDLLWPVLGSSGLDALLQAVSDIEQHAPMRLDGEVLRPDGAGANWRELAGAPEILVKYRDGVGLMDRTAFLAALQ